MMNVDQSAKIQVIGVKFVHAKKHLIGKLVLGFEDKVLNTTKTSPDNKKEHVQKVIALFT